MAELKPCPFCGSVSVELTHDFSAGGWSYVRCKACRCESERIPKSFGISSDEFAIKAWNRRASDD